MKKNLSMLLVIWGNFFVGITFYFFQFSLRTSISVLGPQIKHTFTISPEQLATIAASYFYMYIFFEIFSGILIDKFGIRRMFIIAASSCGAGAIFFGLAHAPWLLYIGRMLMGAGSAFSLVIALTIIKKEFDHHLVPILVGITGAIGVLGGMSGEDLLTLLSHKFHWQNLIIAGGVICFVLALKVMISFDLATDGQSVSKNHAISNKKFVIELLAIFHNRNLIAAFLTAASLFITIDVIASVWGIPFLVHKYHYSTGTSETINTMIFMGFGIGSIGLSLAAKKFRAEYIIKLACLCCLIFSTLYVFSPANLILQLGIALALGISSGGVSAVFIFVGLLAPEAVIATAFSLTELSKHLISAILIQVFGFMIQTVHIHGIGVYTAPFLMILVILTITCIIAFLVIKPVNYHAHKSSGKGAS